MRHLKLSQTRYRELLGQKTTFAIAEEKPRVHHSPRPLEFYRAQPEASAPEAVSELLTAFNYNRFNCPFILLVVMMNPKDNFPNPGGRPLNGGFNTGGGVIVLSSFTLDRSLYFQSTLQHELGHAFGLPHVDVYGYDMKTNASMMSYDHRHETKGFTESRKPGKFIPEDRRGLALNQRAFPGLHFDPEKDIPRGYSISKRIVTMEPMRIPGQPAGLVVTTRSGEEYGSTVANIVRGRIAENEKSDKVTFDAKTMWHSAKTETGWVAVQIAFPYEVELTRIVVHSQHSGQYHIAKAVRVALGDNGEHLRQVIETNLDSADGGVSFPATKGRLWQLELRADETGEVTLRGLQFFSGEDELFPPLVPYRG
jgi:Tfp pilus assembly protein PilZ